MSEIQFFQTAMGRAYYEKTLPELVEQLTQFNLNMAHLRIILLDLASSATKLAGQRESRAPKPRSPSRRRK